jgi:hypothetical protein
MEKQQREYDPHQRTPIIVTAKGRESHFSITSLHRTIRAGEYQLLGNRPWRCLRMLWKVCEPYVPASLLPVFVKVAVKVRTMFLAVFALLAAFLMTTGNILPLVIPTLLRVEELLIVFAVGFLLSLLPPALKLCLYACL